MLVLLNRVIQSDGNVFRAFQVFQGSRDTFDLIDNGSIEGRIGGRQVLQVLEDVDQLVGGRLEAFRTSLVLLHAGLKVTASGK